jgi:hypothetical protein
MIEVPGRNDKHGREIEPLNAAVLGTEPDHAASLTKRCLQAGMMSGFLQ